MQISHQKKDNQQKGHIVLVHGATFQISGPDQWILNNAVKLKSMGYRVTLICQDRIAENLSTVDSYYQGLFPSDAPKLNNGKLRVIVPDINNIIPVYASFQECNFPGIEAKPIQNMTQQQIQTNVSMSAACVRAVCLHDRPFKVIANYMILSGVVVARALQGLDIPYEIIAPGPALRYTIMPYPELWKWIFPAFQKTTRILQRTQFTKRLFMKCFKNHVQQYHLEQKSLTIGPGIRIEQMILPDNYQECERKFLQKIKIDIKMQGENQNLHSSLIKKLQDTQSKVRGQNQYQKLSRDLLDAWIPFSQNDQTIIFVGALINGKGIGQLVAIAPKLILQRPALKFIICGSGPCNQQIHQLLEAYQEGDKQMAKKVAQKNDFITDVDLDDHFIKINKEIRNRIITTGLLSQQIFQYLYPLCSFFIAPNKMKQQCSMAIIQAMAYGLTPICNDHSWFADVMDQIQKQYPQLIEITRVNSKQFFRKLPETIIKTLDFVKNTPFSKRQYRQKIRSIVQKHFSYDHTAKIIAQEIQLYKPH